MAKITKRRPEIPNVKKECFFCESPDGLQPSYTDVATLKKFVSDRGKIVSAGRNGACAKHQRRIGQEIKRARHLSLLPFTIKPY